MLLFLQSFDDHLMNQYVETHRTWGCMMLGCAATLCHAAAQAETAPAVTPYRPSVSTPAALSAPGWLEIEAGLQSSQGSDPLRRKSLPYTLKLAFTPDWGLRIGGDAIVRQRAADGSALSSGGDTSVVLKHRLAVNDASAFGAELGVKLPTARTGVGSGHADAGLNGIYSLDFAQNWHTDINLSATRIGGVDQGSSRWQKGWAAALSRNLSDQWGVVGELSGTRQSASTSQALIATSYSVSPSMTFDLGVSKGLNTASGGWSVFSGVTFLAAHLF